MQNLLILFGVLFVYKVISNFAKLLKMAHFKKLHRAYLESGDNRIVYRKSELVELINKSGTKDASFSHTNFAGCGQIALGQASVIINFPNPDPRVVHHMDRILNETLGVYEKRLFESFSPLYWIESIIFLPKIVLSYLGVTAESVFSKLMTLLYWLLAPLMIAFKVRLNEIMLDILQKL